MQEPRAFVLDITVISPVSAPNRTPSLTTTLLTRHPGSGCFDETIFYAMVIPKGRENAV